MRRNPVGWTQQDEEALLGEFGVGGCCGCDGAYDDGCPLCTDTQFEAWWKARLEAKAAAKTRFDRPEVV